MNPIDKAFRDMLDRQLRERVALSLAQMDQREAFYREHKDHFNRRPVFDPERDWRRS